MRLVLKATAASVLLALGATLAVAQTQTPSKSEPGAPEQGPSKQVPSPSMGTGSRPIGPPSTQEIAPGRIRRARASRRRRAMPTTRKWATRPLRSKR